MGGMILPVFSNVTPAGTLHLAQPPPYSTQSANKLTIMPWTTMDEVYYDEFLFVMPCIVIIECIALYCNNRVLIVPLNAMKLARLSDEKKLIVRIWNETWDE